ncbi:MAG: MFS transporter [Pseudomonadota bacterium]
MQTDHVAAFLRANAAFLAAGVLLTFTSSYGQTFFISIFAADIMAAFELSDGQWGATYAAGTFLSAVAMIWAGQTTDQFRVRVLCLVVMPLFAIACLAMAGATAAWMLALVVFALRFAGQGMTSHIAAVAMARWFVATRGRALSIASLGFAFGEALLPVTFVALGALVDWRWLWALAALLILATMPVLSRLLALERTPQSLAQDAQTDGMRGRHWTRGEVLRHWLFWGMVPFLLGPAAFSTAFFFQQTHIAETKAISHLALVSLFPLFTVVSVGTMLASGILIDRLGTARLMPVSQAPMIAAFLVLGLANGVPGLALGMALMALSVGMNHTLPSAFWSEFYGTRHLGAVKAMATAVMVFGTAIGPLITGALIEAGLPFDDQMIWIAFWFLGACLCTMVAVGRAAGDLPANA